MTTLVILRLFVPTLLAAIVLLGLSVLGLRRCHAKRMDLCVL